MEQINKFWPGDKCTTVDSGFREKDGVIYSPMVDADYDLLLEVHVQDCPNPTTESVFKRQLRNLNFDGLINHDNGCACRTGHVFECHRFSWFWCKFANEFDGKLKEYRGDDDAFDPTVYPED